MNFLNSYSVFTTVIVLRHLSLPQAEKAARLLEPTTVLVFNLEKIFSEKLSKIESKLRQAAVKITSLVKCAVAIVRLEEEESTESKRAFYLLSLVLLVSLLLLSPDKMLQTFQPTQTDTGILETTQEITRIIKKLISNLH